MTDPELLRRAAARAGERRFFLASALLPYARAEGWDDATLASHLGCDHGDLPALLLCRRPTREGSGFRMDVERIAARFGLDAARLARVIRLADALETFATAAPDTSGGLLAAARDRGDDVPDRPLQDPSIGSDDSTSPDSEPAEDHR